MKLRFSSQIWLAGLMITLLLQACGVNAPLATAIVASTDTPKPPKPTSTNTPSPSATPTPTQKTNFTATHRAEALKTLEAQLEEWDAEAQSYFDAGYLTTSEGISIKYNDFKGEWAQLGWYRKWPLTQSANNFFMSAHLKWTSAYRSADTSGCGFVFALQPNNDHYAVFLDKSRVFFVDTKYYYEQFGPTHGTGRVNFDNPFDHPVEADFTLIVNDAYAYVLVDGDVVGEYTLSQSKNLQGTLGLALLSGTNKDFGTRCEMTNLHLWIPKED